MKGATTIRLLALVAATALSGLAGCAVTTLAEHGRTCELVDIAMKETDELAPGWYVTAGEFREKQCGDKTGRAHGDFMACVVEMRHGYRPEADNCLERPDKGEKW